MEVSLSRRGLAGALPERLLIAEEALIASTFVSTKAARTASRRATSIPLPPSSVDTALSATSEVDGVTVISPDPVLTSRTPSLMADDTS